MLPQVSEVGRGAKQGGCQVAEGAWVSNGSAKTCDGIGRTQYSGGQRQKKQSGTAAVFRDRACIRSRGCGLCGSHVCIRADRSGTICFAQIEAGRGQQNDLGAHAMSLFFSP